MPAEIASDIANGATKAAPAIGMAAASAAGWGVQEWMYASTIAYIALQALYLVWKWGREWRARRDQA